MHKNFNVKKISVIGGGSWGTAIACLVARSFGNCIIHTIDQSCANEINNFHKNSRYLGETLLPASLTATTDIKKIISSDIIIIAVPSFAFDETINKILQEGAKQETIFLIATKGMCQNPLQLFSERLESLCMNPYGFISGPNFAKEVAENKFASVTISSKDINLAQNIAKIIATPKLTVNISDDIITVQIAALVKNIVAIKSGMMLAQGHGENSRAWLISMGLNEIAIISKALGGRLESLTLPAVVGDLVLTSYSKTSRNTRFGFDFHNNNYSKEYMQNYPHLVEGISSARILKQYLTNFSDINLPIISSVIEKVQ